MFGFLSTIRARSCNDNYIDLWVAYLVAFTLRQILNCSAELRLVAILMSVRKMNFGT